MQEQVDNGASGNVVWAEPRTNANDFNMVNETTQDANNLERALLYLQESPTATGWIDGASGSNVTFDHIDPYANSADAMGVTWNPDVGIFLENSGEIMSPAITLASEFAHIVEPGGLGDLTTPDPVWQSPAEGIAHQATNVAAVELGEPIRDNYFDAVPLEVPDILSNGSMTDVYGGTIDTSALGTYDGGAFDAGSFAADYGVADFGFDSGLGGSSYGSDSYGFDYDSFSADYGIDFGYDSFDSFGGGGGSGGGGGFSTDAYFEYAASV